MTERIDKTLTADIAEVVRCCKCKNYEHMKQSNECVCSEYGGRVTENDFCSRAVLAIPKGKDGEQNDESRDY